MIITIEVTPLFFPSESEMTDDLDVDAMLEAPFKKEVSGICCNRTLFSFFNYFSG